MADPAIPQFTCDICQGSFTSRNQLFKHIRDIHETSSSDSNISPHASNKQKQTHEQVSSSSGSGISKGSRSGRVARRRNKEERQRKQVHAQGPRLLSLEAFSRRSQALTLQAAQVVSDQLGFVPTNLIEVGSCNTATGEPETVLLYGLNKNEEVRGRYAAGDAKPFPTFIWMSCPLLKARVSRLEDRGLVGDFQARLAADPALVQQMEAAHARYATERWESLSPEDAAAVEQKGWAHNLRDVGVAGMRSADGVKCLHCHLAHFLARPQHGNIIGQWTHEELQRDDEQQQQQRKSGEEEEGAAV